MRPPHNLPTTTPRALIHTCTCTCNMHMHMHMHMHMCAWTCASRMPRARQTFFQTFFCLQFLLARRHLCFGHYTATLSPSPQLARARRGRGSAPHHMSPRVGRAVRAPRRVRGSGMFLVLCTVMKFGFTMIRAEARRTHRRRRSQGRPHGVLNWLVEAEVVCSQWGCV